MSPYNPESVLEDLSKAPTSTPSVEQDACSTKSRPRHPATGAGQSLPTAERAQQRELAWYKKQRRTAAPQNLSEAHRRYLEEAGALLELPRSTTDALLPIYVSFLDDLLPIMDGASVFRDYSNGQSSIYLIRAMCLVTCKFRQAASSLRLREGDSVLQPLEFAKELLDGLDVAIKADLEPDRVTKIQILSLMHLHNDGVSGADRSASYLSQAICEAWSLSLHHNIPGNWDQAQCDCLWWSLRNLDRLNKPVMGAGPFMIDDADVGIERIAAKGDSYRSQLMHVSLVLGDLMKTATKMYKASLKVRADDSADFPSLADLTSRTNFEHFHRSHRGTRPI